MGNKLISLNRDGTINSQGILFPDGTEQTTATLIGPSGPTGAPGSVSGSIYVSTAFEWSIAYQSRWGALTAGTPATLTLPTAPQGINTGANADLPYWIYISGGTGTAEAVLVTGGTATSGSSNGTISFTPYYNHSNYSIGTATAGIQEALNFAGGISSTPYNNGQCTVLIPASGTHYPIHATITMCTVQSLLTGYGAILDCDMRGPALQVGDLTNSTDCDTNTVSGISFCTPNSSVFSNPEFVGSLITSTKVVSNAATITTAAAHGFQVGDPVTILWTDDSTYWGSTFVATVPSPTSFTYAAGANVSLQTTPGVVALSFFAIRDNALNTRFRDINLSDTTDYGHFNGIFDIWDDENCLIDSFSNNGVSCNCNVNWNSSIVASYGANVPQQLAAVITLRDSNLTCNYASGVTVLNSNGLYIDNTVIQASGPWQVYCSNIKGNYSGATLNNIYAESSWDSNPFSPARSPWAGLGVAGGIFGPSTAASRFYVKGQGGLLGAQYVGGSSGTKYQYYVVVNDTTTGTSTPPLPCMQMLSSGGAVTVYWPRVANGTDTITYDVIRTLASAPYPSSGNCPGGSASASGSIVTGQAQGSGFIQSFSDNTTTSTSTYALVPLGGYYGNIQFWPLSCVTVNTLVNADAGVIFTAEGYNAPPVNGLGFFGLNGALYDNDVEAQQALLIRDGGVTGAATSGMKGVLNISNSGINAFTATEIITLVDDNAIKTRMTPNNRPAMDSGDVWIGLDNPVAAISGVQMAMGSPNSISQYIDSVPDNTSWLERLTATLKTFIVPVKTPELLITAATGAPSSSGTAGTAGQIIYYGGFFYGCSVTGAAGSATWNKLSMTSI